MARPRKIQFTKEVLKEMYIDKGMKVSEIASIYGVSGGLVEIRLREFGIKRGTPRNLLELPIETLKEQYTNSGKTMEEISDELGCSESAVRKHLIRAGVYVPSKSNTFTVPYEELRADYWDRGMTVQQIADKNETSVPTVLYRMKKLGISRRPLLKYDAITDDDLKRMYLDQKMTIEEIAKHYACSISAARGRIIKAGFSIDKEEQIKRRLEVNKTNYSHTYESTYRYLKLPEHPASNREGYVTEHRVVIEKEIGRYLTSEEEVHHINMQKMQNDIGNLALVPTGADHHRLHKHLERVAVFVLGIDGALRPEPLVFSKPAFWAGRWVDHIDLIAERESERIKKEFAEAIRIVGDGPVALVN